MKKAYLHIGVEKTGTSTIQSFLAKNRGALEQQGFLYPEAPGKLNHIGLTILASDNRDQFYDLLPFGRVTPDADLNLYPAQMLMELNDEVRKSACHTVVFSNEHLSSRIRAAKAITLLRDTLLSIADAVEVIVYLRRQDEALLSEYSTSVKNGNTKRFALQPHHLIKYNYADLLDRWSAVFGREHMDIRLFEREAFENGDLINDFLQAIRCPHGEAFKRVPPQNVSLDVVCLEYLRRLNKYLPAFVDKRRNMERGYIHAQLAAISIGEKPQLGSEEADEILNQFEASNRDVATRYLNRQDGRLFATSPERSLKNNLVVSDEDMAFKVGAALWRRMRRVR